MIKFDIAVKNLSKSAFEIMYDGGMIDKPESFSDMASAVVVIDEFRDGVVSEYAVVENYFSSEFGEILEKNAKKHGIDSWVKADFIDEKLSKNGVYVDMKNAFNQVGVSAILDTASLLTSRIEINDDGSAMRLIDYEIDSE